MAEIIHAETVHEPFGAPGSPFPCQSCQSYETSPPSLRIAATASLDSCALDNQTQPGVDDQNEDDQSPKC